jgi:hypothetical protein
MLQRLQRTNFDSNYCSHFTCCIYIQLLFFSISTTAIIFFLLNKIIFQYINFLQYYLRSLLLLQLLLIQNILMLTTSNHQTSIIFFNFFNQNIFQLREPSTTTAASVHYPCFFNFYLIYFYFVTNMHFIGIRNKCIIYN